MLRWSLTFFVLSICAGVLGLSGISAVTADMGKLFFFIFLVLFIISIVTGMFRGKNKQITII